MLTNTEAQMYLADHRGCTQSDHYRSWHTFNFGSYQQESRMPFEALQAFNDNTLLAGKQHLIHVEQPTEFIILPIVGGLDVTIDQDETCFVGAGEAFQFLALPNKAYKLANPFDPETINFLEIWLTPTEAIDKPNIKALTSFNLQNRNELLPLFDGRNQPYRTFIGMYNGRQAGEYAAQEKQVFIFVIQGAFEVQNRLLHPRDGLALWNLNEPLEFEALSNDAILLIMEIAST